MLHFKTQHGSDVQRARVGLDFYQNTELARSAPLPGPTRPTAWRLRPATPGVWNLARACHCKDLPAVIQTAPGVQGASTFGRQHMETIFELVASIWRRSSKQMVTSPRLRALRLIYCARTGTRWPSSSIFMAPCGMYWEGLRPVPLLAWKPVFISILLISVLRNG